MIRRFFGGIWGFIKRHRILTTVVVIIAFFVLNSLLRGDAAPEREVVTAGRATVAQEVEVTGRVEPAEKIELSIESGGQVRSVPVKVGDKVTAGQTLLAVDTADLQVRLGRQQAALRRAEIAVEELERPGSLTVLSSQNQLVQARENRTTAQTDLQIAYEDGFSAVADAFLDLPDAISGIDDILGRSYLSSNIIRSKYGDDGLDFLDAARDAHYDAEDLYDRALDEYRGISRESTGEEIEPVIDLTYEAAKEISDAIKAVNNLVDYVEREDESSSPPASLVSDQSELDTLTADTNSHLSGLLGARNDMKNAREDLSNADREIAESEREVYDLTSGADLERARLDYRQASLDVQDTLLQIGDRSVRSPIAGTVTEVNAQVGELVSSGTVAAAVISENQFQVDAGLPEADLAKVRVGASAQVVLDTYGDDVVFEAVVVAVDPAETLLDGVAVYGMTLEFAQMDERIKSGLTADITVRGERRENVMAVPQRAVITRGGTKYVRLLEGEQEVEREVETGLRGSDGNVEITSGLTGGEQVIVFVQE